MIDISEKLPPEYEDVLVYVKMKDPQDNYYSVAYRNKKGFLISPLLLLVGNVIRWMPLPDATLRKKK